MADGRLKYSCKFPNCQNKYYWPNINNKHFFRFPVKDKPICDKWRNICQIGDVSCVNFYVCEDHFLPSDIFGGVNRSMLVSQAVPIFRSLKLQSQILQEHNYFAPQSQTLQEHDNLAPQAQILQEHNYFAPQSKTLQEHENSAPQSQILQEHNYFAPQSQILQEHSYFASQSQTLPEQSDFVPESQILEEHNYVSPQFTNVTGSIDEISDLLPSFSSNFNTANTLLLPNEPNFKFFNVSSQSASTNGPNFDFLLEVEDLQGPKGIMGQPDISSKNFTDREQRMYKVHRNVCSKLSKLKSCLNKERNKNSMLKELLDKGKFSFIEENLNDVTKNFIQSQLRNFNKTSTGKRWTTEDKVFALSMYKRSPRLYRYIQHYFELPSIRTLKRVLSKLPFNPGFNDKILEHLKLEVAKMSENDRYCNLLFDEMSLDPGFQYDPHRQLIVGFEDLGHLGRSIKPANHALVFMIRGVRKQWKQVIAYYFTASTISTDALCLLIPFIILKLQGIGLKPIATVCDQGITNQAALKKLSHENNINPTPYTFNVNEEEICIIFDVPHLLKLTRNALLRGILEFEKGKYAKFEYIESSFMIDKQTRTFSQLPYLRPEHFNFKDSYMKMKVKIAARQLSHSMAASIETNVSVGKLNTEAIYTAEFAELIDQLFDLLNSNSQYPMKGKKHRCAFSAESPHLTFFSELLPKLANWKLYEADINDSKNPNKFKDITNKQHFINGWQITIRSVIHLWNKLKDKFLYLPMRSFNQDPLENLFGLVRQHGIFNTNPTCKQFTAALKTTVLNGLAVPISGGNVELDYCENISNLSSLLYSSCDSESSNITPFDTDEEEEKDHDFNFENITHNFGTAYTAGYLISKVVIPDCSICKDKIFASEIGNEHLFVQFKEYNNSNSLKYASSQLIEMCDKIFKIVESFLESRGHESNLEIKIKMSYKSTFQSFIFCNSHVDVYDDLINKCIRLSIFKYCRDKKNPPDVSKGHTTKMSRFKKQKLCHDNTKKTETKPI